MNDSDEQSPLVEEREDSVIIYNHPLQGVQSVNQLYPIADIQDNPITGKRYAVQDLSLFNTDGTVVHTSGVIELDVRIMTAAEKAAIAAAKGSISPPPGHEQVGAALVTALASLPSTTELEINLFLVVEEVEPAFVTIEKEIARGNVVTQADVDAKHQELVDEAALRTSAVQSVVVSDIRNLGGTVTGTCDTMPCMFATMQAGQIASLVGHPDIAAMELNGKVVPDALMTGTQVIRGSQVEQFIDATYDGEVSPAIETDDLRFAIIEIDNYVDTHKGFKDSSGSVTRISSTTGRYNCSTAVCNSTPFFSLPSSLAPQHATMMAGIIFGDLRDGQDPGVANATARVDRSGYAGEAWGVLYRAIASPDGTGAAGSVLQAMNHLAATASRPRVVNMSNSVETEDPQCKGQTPANLAVNHLFEAGTLVFKSAGNTGHAVTTDCTVGAPGAAIGAFTVGAHGYAPADWSGTVTNVRTSPISVVSARGGTTTEGGRRTIIDLTGFGYRVGLFDISGGYDNGGNGTSIATPTVTAAALDFIDMHKRIKGNLIDNPGLLFVNMLLMGDRQGTAGKLTSKFDSLYGAGRMMMRMFTKKGIDAPGAWASNFVCVGQDEVVNVPINNGAVINPAADIFKAVIFWYDRRHGKGVAIDDIDLDLTYVSNGNTLGVSSASLYDNKERLFYQGIGGKAVQLEISGYGVTADDEGCGVNKQRVYYAYLYEDSARDDGELNGEGPTLDKVQTE